MAMPSLWTDNFRYGSKDQLHAIGVLISAWNSIEFSLSHLYRILLEISAENANQIFKSHSNDDRLDLIGRLAPDKFSNELADQVSALRTFAAICKDNRNHVAHSMTWFSGFDGDDLVANKFQSKAGEWVSRRFSLELLRRAAEDADAVAKYASSIVLFAQIKGAKPGVDFVNEVQQGHQKIEIRVEWPRKPKRPISIIQPTKAFRTKA